MTHIGRCAGQLSIPAPGCRGRKVLLPPSALGRPDTLNRELAVDLGSDRIEGCPGLEADAPVSRQLEAEIYRHYDWSPYWTGGYGFPVAAPVSGGVAGSPVPPAGIRRPPGAADADEPFSREPRGDPHLRSVGEVTGYYVEASDGNIGHIEDFIVEDEHWAVHYLMVDTRNWWPGRMVLISPQWLRDISWSERKVFLEVSREKVRESPEYEPDTALDRAYEERLYRHYGYPPYWSGAGGGI